MFEIYKTMVIEKIQSITVAKEEYQKKIETLESELHLYKEYAIKSIVTNLKKDNFPKLCSTFLEIPVGNTTFLEIGIRQIFTSNDIVTETVISLERKNYIFLDKYPFADICNRITAQWDGIATITYEEIDDQFFNFCLKLY